MVFSSLCENKLGCQELEHTALQQYLQAPPRAQGLPDLLQPPALQRETSTTSLFHLLSLPYGPADCTEQLCKEISMLGCSCSALANSGLGLWKK